MKSLDHTTINRRVSSVVLAGRRRMTTEHGPAVNALPDGGDCVVFEIPSLVKAFIEATERDW
jgi:hypothetical protein